MPVNHLHSETERMPNQLLLRQWLQKAPAPHVSPVDAVPSKNMETGLLFGDLIDVELPVTCPYSQPSHS